MTSSRGFLKREGFEFDKKPAQIDKAYLKLFTPDEAENIRAIWTMMQMGSSATALYRTPRTLQQAHLLMSYDRERYVAGFDWILTTVQRLKATSVLEVGCGTGVLLRYLKEHLPEVGLKGIDAEPALVGSAPPSDIDLVVGDYLSLPALPSFDVIVCNFGFDSDKFAPSTQPHSVATIGESKFCPGCSDDLAKELGPYMRAWRSWGTPGAKLLLVGRLPSIGAIRAFEIAAAAVGWSIVIDESDVLKVGEPGLPLQRYPALVFDAPMEADLNKRLASLEHFYRKA